MDIMVDIKNFYQKSKYISAKYLRKDDPLAKIVFS